MRLVYSFYKVKFFRSGQTLTIKAKDRHGRIFIADIRRTSDSFFEGFTDFGHSNKKTLKGIILQFFQNLVNEVRVYDKAFYSFGRMTTTDENGTRLTEWHELSNEPKPTFEGGVEFLSM